jgi:hypothetical protein
MRDRHPDQYHAIPLLGGVIVALLSGLICGAEPGPVPVERPVVVSVQGVYLGPADFSRGGQVSLWEGDLGVDLPLSPTTGTMGRLSFHSDVMEVDTRGAVGRMADLELDPLLTTTVGYLLAIPGTDGWSSFFRGGISDSGESGAPAEDSLLYNGMGGAEYAINQKLSIQMSLLATTRLEEDPLVLPLVGFRWRPAPAWLVATEGAGLKITGPLQRDLQFTVNAGWMTRAWRLDDDAPTPQGILAMEAIRFETGLRWKCGKAWQFETRIGWEPSRTYHLLDEEGQSSGIRTSDGAPLAVLSATYPF